MAEKRVIDTDKTRTVLDALVKYGRYSDGIIKEAKERLGILGGAAMPYKTMSIRMDEEDCDFVKGLAKEAQAR